MLTGEAKKIYQREYMRRKRAGQPKPAPAADVRPALDPDVRPALDPTEKADLEARIRELEAELTRVQRKTKPRHTDQEFEQHVRAECEKRLEETILPHYRERLAHYEDVIKSHNGVMTRKTFRKILACLHTDRGASDKALAEAFDTFKKLELVLCKEEEMPRPARATDLPRTMAEMMARRAAAKAAKKRPPIRPKSVAAS